MNNNLRLIVNNVKDNQIDDKHFFEKEELKVILDLYARMVSQGSWKDYGLSISSKQVGSRNRVIRNWYSLMLQQHIKPFT